MKAGNVANLCKLPEVAARGQEQGLIQTDVFFIISKIHSVFSRQEY